MSSQEQNRASSGRGERDFANIASAWERTPGGGYVSVVRIGNGPPIFKVVRPEDISGELGIPKD